ncbi:(Fe-S)-binding protein [Thioalkalivibrio paradoxus ARh 1]|uniref:(Fe-S)-binding protein n=1 Tax=Thioalkalivibrio paradoxus ARh 1 TaxID=713585 RepID=W0DFY2_9GAMM|nr:(Fe-S)-binding protein [Thioalkalivibrio paradoxus ARh 1]
MSVLYSNGREPLIEGHLGSFRVTVQVGGRTANVATLMHSGQDAFDLVLDLGLAPLITAEWPPLGYFAPAFGDPEAFDQALESLRELRGEFEKPKFFEYDPGICAHSRSGIQGCTRCIDACPAVAIRSLGETIEVQPELCQGGGICATVCPTGAITYAYPRPADLILRVQTLLGQYREHGGEDPVLLFFDDESGAEPLERMEPLPGEVLAIEVDELGSVGLDVLLSSLAAGAREVLLLDTPALPAKVRRNLQEQLGHARAILQALGYPRQALRLAQAGAGWTRGTEPMPVIEPARVNGSGGKRSTLYAALDHLHAEAPAPQSEIALQTGAPFGAIRVDLNACTLCMACAAVCPAQAVSTPGDTPRLDFTEARCVQCGICERSCPEQAISLSPRLLTDRLQRDRSRVLHEEEPFACVACGKPFATRSMIDQILHRLDGHPMFQDEAARRRLMMCEDCRVIDMFQAGQGGPGGTV